MPELRDSFSRPRSYLEAIRQVHGEVFSIRLYRDPARGCVIFEFIGSARCPLCGVDTPYSTTFALAGRIMGGKRPRFFVSRCLDVLTLRYVNGNIPMCQACFAANMIPRRPEEGYCNQELIKNLNALDEKHRASRRG